MTWISRKGQLALNTADIIQAAEAVDVAVDDSGEASVSMGTVHTRFGSVRDGNPFNRTVSSQDNQWQGSVHWFKITPRGRFKPVFRVEQEVVRCPRDGLLVGRYPYKLNGPDCEGCEFSCAGNCVGVYTIKHDEVTVARERLSCHNGGMYWVMGHAMDRETAERELDRIEPLAQQVKAWPRIQVAVEDKEAHTGLRGMVSWLKP